MTAKFIHIQIIRRYGICLLRSGKLTGTIDFFSSGFCIVSGRSRRGGSQRAPGLVIGLLSLQH